MDWQAVVIEPIRQALGSLLGFLPNILGALVILFVGWLVAKTIEGAFVRVLKSLRLDKLAQQIQLAQALDRGGIRLSLSELIGALVYWGLILVVFIAVLNALQLTVAAALFQRVAGYLPNVLASVFLLIVGIFAAVFLGTTVRAAASNVGLASATFLGQVTQVAIVVFVSVTALEQLGIQFVGEVFRIVLLAFSFGAALAFGLGCKDIAGRWVEGLIAQVKGKRS